MKVFNVKAKVWKWNGQGPWHFVYVSDKDSSLIKKISNAKRKVGFGFIPIEAEVGKTKWTTSLFPTKEGPYLLSIKASVRKSEGIFEGDMVNVKVKII